MAKVTKPPPPDYLTMQLFAPGMSALHRAGLGGLACTLKAMERQYEDELLPKAKLPAPFDGDNPPWEIDEQTITLRFGKPEKAGEYLKKLFAFAFQIKDGLIYLPGQYGNVPPNLAVLVAIQDGIQNTFLQHGPTCGSRSGEQTVTIEVNDTPLSVTHDVFTSYKHQGWFWLDRDERGKEKDPSTGKKQKTGRRVQNHQSFPVVCDDGTLSRELHEIDNKISPGGMVRHDRFDQSAIRETDEGLICLHFAMIGCLTLSINRVTAVLVVPEVLDLLVFSQSRSFITPQKPVECRIANATDAALQAQIRVRARRTANDIEVPACYTMTCRPTQWNKKQKPRVSTAQVPVGSDRLLDRFERALSWLQPRLIVPAQPTPKKSKRNTPAKQPQPFWSDSIVRPLIAENLALGRPWYLGFIRLMTQINPASKKPYRDHLDFERQGLHAMISDETMWDSVGESTVVRAVHEALRNRYGRIADQNKKSPVAMRTRFAGEYDRWRLAFSGAKTGEQFRKALCDLFSRAGTNAVLQQCWQDTLPMLRTANWQHARDLALLALCSYQSRGETTPDDQAKTTN
jgi:CRISPR-associated protein Cas8a1/Csx13